MSHREASWPEPKPYVRWAAAAWIACCFVILVRAYLMPDRQTVYTAYAMAGREWLAGGDPYELERIAPGGEVVMIARYRYAPLASAIFVPYGFMPDDLGGVVWRVLSFTALAVAFYWFTRTVVPGGDRWTALSWATLWLVLLPMSLPSMNNGQANVLMTALILSAVTATRFERWNLAALCVAGGFFLKLYPLAIGLLLAAIYPRQLLWRLTFALGAGFALPFALQQPDYVWRQYENWVFLLSSDYDRSHLPIHEGYRDIELLARWVGLPLSDSAHLCLQLGSAAMIAALCLAGRWLWRWPRQHLLTTLVALGCGWIAVFGPATESCTFIVLGPALACALADAGARPLWRRWLLFGVLGVFLLTFAAAWFRGGRNWSYLLQPMAALLFLCEGVIHALRQTKEGNMQSQAVFTQAA
ncbi:MAG: DUF2029 domain-containing protein [Gemmataceae bacterium]|nr:DUF2029 domain-containing protein [Gemmataceae bacterium]